MTQVSWIVKKGLHVVHVSFASPKSETAGRGVRLQPRRLAAGRESDRSTADSDVVRLEQHEWHRGADLGSNEEHAPRAFQGTQRHSIRRTDFRPQFKFFRWKKKLRRNCQFWQFQFAKSNLSKTVIKIKLTRLRLSSMERVNFRLCLFGRKF